MHERGPLLLGILLGRVEVRAREEAFARGVGARALVERAQLRGHLAQQLHLDLVERDDDRTVARTLELHARAPLTYDGCSIVAHRPWACSRATSTLALLARAVATRPPCPRGAPASIKRVAFSRE